MKGFARRLLLLLAALALVAGAPVAFAVPPALAMEPCPHEHQHGKAGEAHHQHHQPEHPHDHGAAGCLCCCIGACLAIPDLAHAPVAVVPYAASPVRYWDTGLRLTGRSIRPDPAPPRPTLLS